LLVGKCVLATPETANLRQLHKTDQLEKPRAAVVLEWKGKPSYSTVLFQG